MKNVVVFSVKLASLCVLALAMTQGRASADPTFNFNFSGAGTGFSFSGSLSTSETVNTDGSYTITTLLGTIKVGGVSSAISLDPPTPATGSFDGNDNELYFSTPAAPGTGTHLDGAGVSVTTSSMNYNIFYSQGLGSYYVLNSASVVLSTTFTITPATVPEPASIVSACTGGFVVIRICSATPPIGTHRQIGLNQGKVCRVVSKNPTQPSML